jgi:hypothetical protein
MPTIKAEENPDLVNEMIQSVLSDADTDVEPDDEDSLIVPPPDTVFDLPAGLSMPGFPVQTELEVRELTGRDEQAIARSKTPSATAEAILMRGVVRVGDVESSKDMLNAMLAGDRDFALLKIFAVTFGSEVELTRYCPGCETEVEITVDVNEDVPIKTLPTPSAAYFEVTGKSGTIKATLPTGITQKALQDAGNKTYSELSTILLANTVLEINGRPVLGEADVLAMSIKDRRTVAEAIATKSPGPRLQDVTKSCPECETELEVPLSLAALFQF